MTYSIVARDPSSGELGVAVQSHYFSVGPVVPWARPGVGAVATQSMVNITFGPRGLDLMAAGKSPQAALDELLAEDEGRDSRQVALIDAKGRVAVHTGARCIVHAGHVVGDAVSCQANIMVTPEIWGAMLEAYEAARGQGATMARRLLAAMDAAEALGGDARGRQSAALLVVPAEGEAWQKVVELRVEDHPDPLLEMARLLSIQEAYALASQADDELVEGRHEAAGQLFQAALTLLPDSHELKFWSGASLAHAGDLEAGTRLVREAIEAQPGWRWLLPQLSDEQVPGVEALARKLGLTAPE
ncbi:MAG TPA: DUF1028 domain-containing protein [Solirubrobacteraceae bacterium]|nr:DUF1028 domain-containing protein [Solirubrobacteraceae bacterium]